MQAAYVLSQIFGLLLFATSLTFFAPLSYLLFTQSLNFSTG